MRITVLDKGGVIFLVPERRVRAYRGIARGTSPRGFAKKRTATDSWSSRAGAAAGLIDTTLPRALTYPRY